MSSGSQHNDENQALSTREGSVTGILHTRKSLTRNSSTMSNLKDPGRHSSVRRCISDSDRDSVYDVTGSTVIVTMLILSPPIVLIGVILLTTGAIISNIFVLVAGLATILSGVLIAATSAFVFVRMRGGVRSRGSMNESRRSDNGGVPTGRGSYYRVTMDLERSANSADGSFRVEITEQPATMVTFFSSADSDTQSMRGNRINGSNTSSLSSTSGTMKAIGVKLGSENSSPG
ncbi:uncharacterized protein LOC121422188 [Lytechinus variegatus]|uniref:uncharacterized protein LOC121422188 n=1 Tax=Lytechinus variegatus TaxID=7654 RepID=UPI001BB26269|nr:uncharacterized protein LOC121422188 [Lytechinus variegatus]